VSRNPIRISIIALIFSIIFTMLTIPSSYAAECTNSSVKQNGYMYYAFKSLMTCQFTLPIGTSLIDYLIVGGGGGGGSRAGGGGGAGGFRTATDISVTGISSISITVGDGGVGGPASRAGGTVGDSSTVVIGATAIAAMGGGGGHDSGYSASVGGASSGGGTGNVSRLALSVSGQGNLGGSGIQTCGGNDWCGGGGGGAGAVGGAATSTTSGAGGNGLSVAWLPTDIANTLAVGDTSTGSAFFSGGGSGGRGSNSTPNIGTAGNGGGGLGAVGCSGASCVAGAAGKSFTGGGGGGGGYQFGPPDYSGPGGKGGSGVVLIRIFIPATSISSSISGSAIYRSPSTITAIVSVIGRVTFYANGKKIPGCVSIIANLSAQCIWKPSTRGSVTLTQMFTPSSNVYSNASATPLKVFILNRTGRR
jgi:hypothetical protein